MSKYSLFLLSLAFMPELARSELVYDPLGHKLTSGDIVGFVGTSLVNETEYDFQFLGESVDVQRQTLDLGGVYMLSSDVGISASLHYDSSASIKASSVFTKTNLDGYQLSFGGFRKLSILQNHASVAWVELNLVSEEYSEPDETADWSTTEISAGMLFQVLETGSAKFSAGPELLISSDGDFKLTVSEFGTETISTDRDLLGLKAIASVPLNNEFTLYGQLSLLNETRLALSIGKKF